MSKSTAEQIRDELRHGSERRYKVVYARLGEVLQACQNTRHGAIRIPEWTLPDGASVVSVEHDFCRQAFAFLLYHPDWPIVPDGERVPDAMPLTVSCQYIELREGEDGKYGVAESEAKANQTQTDDDTLTD